MGQVNEYITEMVTKQIKDNHLVVWFDPEEIYRDIVKNLEIPDATVARYEDSFIELRHNVAPLMMAEDPPNLLIYVPMLEEETEYALIGYTKTGIVIKPHQNPWQRNTSLGVIANQALKPLIDDEKEIDDINKKVDRKELTLTDLNTLADRIRKSSHQKILSLIYRTQTPQEITLSFLNHPGEDEELIRKNALEDLKTFFNTEYGAEITGDTISICREEIARYLLVSSFIAHLDGYVPDHLSRVPHAPGKKDLEACAQLVYEWQMRRDLQKQYVETAKKVEQAFGVNDSPLSLDQLKDLHTFQGTDRSVLTMVEQALLEDSDDGLEEIARKREDGFWAEVEPKLKARWHLVASIAAFFNTCKAIEKTMNGKTFTAGDIAAFYTDSENPWCSMDTLYRYVEKDYINIEYDTATPPKSIKNLYAKVRTRYMELGGTIATRFTEQLVASQFSMPDCIHQTEIFSEYVTPAMEHGKVAYVLVDAFRYEMANELVRVLPPTGSPTIHAACAIAPTITEVGMAALMLNRDTSPSLVSVGGGKLAIDVNGTILKDRPSRLKYLSEHVDGEVFSLKIGDLLNASKTTTEGIQNADLVLVTSQEIDEFAENAETYQARRYMDDVLHTLGRAFNALSENGVSTIIVTADHGYLFGEEIDDPMKIPSPGGETADLHRRVWVGKGGASNDAYCYFRASDQGIGGDLEIAVPCGFGVFKVAGGGIAYFHGGLSPQEYIIPVITLHPSGQPQDLPTSFHFNLELGTPTITNRVCMVKITGKATTLADIKPPKVRVEIWSEGQLISQQLGAHYGYEEETQDVILKMDTDDSQTIDADTITLLIPPGTTPGKTASIHMLDATTGVLLKKLENINVQISF